MDCYNKEVDLSNLDNLDLDNLSDETLMNIFQTNKFDEEDNDGIKKNIDKENMCMNCNKKNTLVEDFIQGILVCNECGQVNENIMDQKPEWRDYEDSKNNRCSMPTNPLLEQSSIGTSIAGPIIGNVKRLNFWGMMPYKERSLYQVLKDIKHKCQRANILKCIEADAKIFYKKISECKHTKGKNEGKYIIIRGKHRKSLIAACIFFACKKNKKSRSVKEIAQMFDINYRDVTKGCKTFWKLINLRNIQLCINNSSPEDYVYRFCNELKIGKDNLSFAQKIAKNVKRLSIASTHTDMSIATASILLTILMNDLTITKKHIAEKFKVSEVTISKTYKSIEKYRDILIDDEKTEKILKQLDKEREEIVMPPNIAEKYKLFQETYEGKVPNNTSDNKTDNVNKVNNIDINNIEDELELLEEPDMDDLLEEAISIEKEIELDNSFIDSYYKKSIMC